MMHGPSKRQDGASKISNLVFLAILAFGIYLAIQYVPHFFAIQTIGSVMDSLREGQVSKPAGTAAEVTSRINNQLNIDQKDDLRSAFTVREDGRGISVTAVHDWELNLLFQKKPMRYETTLVLK